MNNDGQCFDVVEWLEDQIPNLIQNAFFKYLDQLREYMLRDVPEDQHDKFDLFFDLLVESQEQQMKAAIIKFQLYLTSQNKQVLRNCIAARIRSHYPSLGRSKSYFQTFQNFHRHVQNQQKPRINQFTSEVIEEFRKEFISRNKCLDEQLQQIKEIDEDDLFKKYLFDS